jgi:uncharacterized protein YdgA (DUF945 family)
VASRKGNGEEFCVKKWLFISAVGAFGFLFLVLPILVGFALERGYPLLIERVQESAGGLDVLEASLDRGLLDSSAVTRIRPASADSDRAPIRLSHSWAHGPFPLSEWLGGHFFSSPVLAVVRTEVDPEGVGGSELVATLAGQPLAEVVVRVNFDGTLDIEATTPAFEMADGRFMSEGMRAEVAVLGGIRGVRGKLEVDPWALREGGGRAGFESSLFRFHGVHSDSGSRLDGSFDLGAVRLAQDGRGGVRISESQGLFKASRAHNELDASSLTVEFGEVQFSIPDQDLSSQGGILGGHLQLDARTGSGRLEEMRGVLSLDALTWGEETFGPGLARVSLGGMDWAAAADFREALAALEESGPASGRGLEAKADLLREWLPVLLRASPELDLESFELEGPTGKLSGKGWLKVDGRDPEAFAEEMTAMEAIEGRSAWVIPRSMLHAWVDTFLIDVVAAESGGLPREEIVAMTEFMRDMTVARLLDTGMLEVQDEAYRVEVRFEQGVLIVNGKLLGPDGLSGLLMGG